MAADERYTSGDVRDYLNERGSRYKRNVLGLSAALMATAWIPGLKLDTDGIPLLDVSDPFWLWMAVTTVLLFNAGFLLFHIWQDYTVMEADYFNIHLGKPDVLETGDSKDHCDEEGKLIYRWERKGEEGGDQFIQRQKGGGLDKQGNQIFTSVHLLTGLIVSEKNRNHLRRKRRFFIVADIAFPALLLIGGLAAIATHTLSAPASALSHTITDGDTIRIGEERIRIIGLDTPEVFKPQCRAERMLGDQATRRLGEILSSGAMTVERKGLDKYKRTLAVISVDGKDVAPVMIAEGLAMKRRPKDGWCTQKKPPAP